MYWLGVAFGIALLATLLTRGSVVRLLGLPIQSLWLLIVGLGVQIALWVVDVPNERIDDLGFGLLMLSYALLLAFCFVNLRVRGMAIVAIGVAMNAIVTGLNEGMPTRDEEVETRSGRTVERPVERTATERPESDDDLLPFFGQIIRLPENPVDDSLAPGDLVIAAGMVVVFVSGGRRRRRRAVDRAVVKPPEGESLEAVEAAQEADAEALVGPPDEIEEVEEEAALEAKPVDIPDDEAFEEAFQEEVSVEETEQPEEETVALVAAHAPPPEPPPPPPEPVPPPEPPPPAPRAPAPPAPAQPRTAAEEWEAWQAELRSITGDLDDQTEAGDDTAT
ncbi:MAG: DUF5317 family protein [Acidimicrobiia bacterium]